MQKGTLMKEKSVTSSGIPGIKKTLKKPEARAPPKTGNESKIRDMLRNNPTGANAMVKQTQAEPKQRMEYVTDGINQVQRQIQPPPSIQIAHRNQGQIRQVNQMHQPNQPRVDDSPLLENDGMELPELKQKHERLVDLILEEEDELISNHHRFIETTINSGKILDFSKIQNLNIVKDQEKLRHEVNMPGSDVEEYIISLDKLISQDLNEITALKSQISRFHTHIKQEQQLSQKFYEMQEDDKDFGDDDY